MTDHFKSEVFPKTITDGVAVKEFMIGASPSSEGCSLTYTVTDALLLPYELEAVSI